MIRFGIVGTNWITERFINAASLHPEFSLKSVYSRTEERAAEFAGKYGADHLFTSIEEMAKCNEIDAVYIASPNSFHAEQAIVLMEHGKHVLCEKPIASNAWELTKMIEIASKHNVVLMEAMKSTLTPNFRAVQDNLHKIGTVRRYVASYCQYSSRYNAYKEGTVLNAFRPEFSNGSLMDIGIYCIYPMIVLFGQPKTLKATGYLLESGVDGEGSIIFEYEDKEAVVMYSKITNSSLPSEIQGEDGNIIIDNINTPENIKIVYRDGTVENITVEQRKEIMYYETEEFITLINNKHVESNINSHANSLAVMSVIDQARKQIGMVYPSDFKQFENPRDL